ncbi:MAG: hypothetical protein EA427_05660 [Spirochaetaceae bacterium]|nr:MAG: hypothetical protein EA427_05660 [Spirochaetaceae bacterium]
MPTITVIVVFLAGVLVGVVGPALFRRVRTGAVRRRHTLIAADGTLDADLSRTQADLALMADRAYEMLMVVLNFSQVPDDIDSATDRTIMLRSDIKEREEQTGAPLLRSIQRPCTPEQARRIQQHQRIAQELSLVADDCYKTMRLLARSHRKKYRFHEESQEELFGFISQIMDFLRYHVDYLEGKIGAPQWELANTMEDAIDRVRDKLKKRTRRILEKSDDADIAGELAFIDIVSHLEHVGDRCLSIAEVVSTIRA